MRTNQSFQFYHGSIIDYWKDGSVWYAEIDRLGGEFILTGKTKKEVQLTAHDQVDCEQGDIAL